jgi:hypothetical protein
MPPRSSPTAPMAGVHRYEPASELLGAAIRLQEIVERVRGFAWDASLIRLSVLAGLVANSRISASSPDPQLLLIDALLTIQDDTEQAHRLRTILARQRGRITLAHEAAIVTLQHLVILEGADTGPAPPDTDIAIWIIAINDYLDEWSLQDVRELTRAEELIAAQAHAYRFDNSPDWLREILRVYETLSVIPHRNQLHDAAAWQEIQDIAFGTDFQTYFETFVAPLALLSKGWGTATPAGQLLQPVMTREHLEEQLAAPTTMLDRWISTFSADRATLQAKIKERMRPDSPVPHSPTALYYTPAVSVDKLLIFTSPWAVRVQLKTGIWFAFMNAVKRKHGQRGALLWTSTFGDLFERWAARVAQSASDSRWFRGEVLLPSAPGAADEIEDVVVREGRACVLFSAKARLVPENVARQAKSRSELIDWYDSFFFADATGEFRQGAVRLLNDRITMVRDGAFEPRLPRDIRIIPVLVTYDSLCEHILLYERIRRRCEADGLLQQRDVAPLALARIEDFEDLLSHASGGGSTLEILRKRESAWRDRRLDALFAAQRPPLGRRRLPMIQQAFDALIERVLSRMSQKRIAARL